MLQNNYQGFGYILTVCKKRRNGRSLRGRKYREGFQNKTNWKENRNGCKKGKMRMQMNDQSVKNESEYIYVNSMNRQKDNRDFQGAYNRTIFHRLTKEERKIRMNDKEGRDRTSGGIGEIAMEQKDIKNKVKLMNILLVSDVNSNLFSVKLADYGHNVFQRFGAMVYKNSERTQTRAMNGDERRINERHGRKK